jgi:enoyl-[acyl-carrier protein] reductase III
MSNHPTLCGWALVLGASSGFGEATSLHLARCGMNIFGVHLDRKGTLANVDRITSEIKGLGREAHFFNVNAADEAKRAEVLEEAERVLEGRGEQGQVKVLLHTLAFGTLKPYLADDKDGEINKAQMDMTVDVMAHSLVYWIQDLVRRKLMVEGGRIFAMTSSGGTRVMPTYGAVSAAKAALESHIRQLALELAPLGITANAVRAGVTDTPALRKIPGNEKIVSTAMERNPHRRLTTAAEVARAIALFAHPDAYWVSGNTIGVDGGEDVTG